MGKIQLCEGPNKAVNFIFENQALFNETMNFVEMSLNGQILRRDFSSKRFSIIS